MSKEKEIRDKNEKKEKDNEWVSDWASESNQIKRKQWKKMDTGNTGAYPKFFPGEGVIFAHPFLHAAANISRLVMTKIFFMLQLGFSIDLLCWLFRQNWCWFLLWAYIFKFNDIHTFVCVCVWRWFTANFYENIILNAVFCWILLKISWIKQGRLYINMELSLRERVRLWKWERDEDMNNPILTI